MAIHFGGFNLDCDVDCYGFRKSVELNEGQYRSFIAAYFPVLVRRLKRWESVLSINGHKNISNTTDLLKKRFTKRKLNRFIEKGIPSSLRPRVWMSMSGAERASLANPGLFEAYSCTRLPEDVANAIDIDLDRTFPDNQHFRYATCSGSVALKQVLRAVAAKRPQLGYCQGFNFLVAMLLLVLKTAENAFWLVDAVLERFPADFYDADMRGLRIELSVLTKLIQEHTPDLHGHFTELGADVALLTTKWFVCWFVESLPVETVFRIWDCLFASDPDVLIRVAYTIISRRKDVLLACGDFQQLIAVFQGDLVADQWALNCHQFIQDVLTTREWLSADRLRTMRRSSDQI